MNGIFAKGVVDPHVIEKQYLRSANLMCQAGVQLVAAKISTSEKAKINDMVKNRV